MQEMLEQIDTGERGRALMTLMQILQIRPSYLLQPALVWRLFERRNVGRFLRLLRLQCADVSRTPLD